VSEDLTNKLPANQDQKLTRVLDAVEELSIRVEKLDRKVEERLYDTRPMWEQLASKVDQLQEGQTRLEERHVELQRQMQESLQELRQGQDDLREGSRDLKTYLRDILRRMSILNDTLVTIQADYRDIYDRVRGLELKTEVNGQCDL
jgi:septation ring formation regulator EzrA